MRPRDDLDSEAVEAEAMVQEKEGVLLDWNEEE